MRALRHNPHPVDQSDLFPPKLKIVRRDKGENDQDFLDEDLTVSATPVPVSRSGFQKFRESVSKKLFSFELGKIDF